MDSRCPAPSNATDRAAAAHWVAADRLNVTRQSKATFTMNCPRSLSVNLTEPAVDRLNP